MGLRKGNPESENCNKMEMRSNHEKGVHVWRDTTKEKKETGEGWKRGHGGKKRREYEKKSIHQIITRNSKYDSTPI